MSTDSKEYDSVSAAGNPLDGTECGYDEQDTCFATLSFECVSRCDKKQPEERDFKRAE
ncbi:hypothetical protein Godav_000397 [Gossypium davidsonii]|uniref:Uncharacterized protein n=2 Tax=Gossypium TaxID=3633 RepID=A0A7J8T158_GOSDV|nr:hypothetical protein [Gossypium davidsonii]MBA0667232.1 hypothetical protein [Gossypium klotzschianum]